MQGFLSDFFTVFFVLIVVLVIAWMILKVIKRTHFGKQSDDTLSFLRTLPVGNRERVVLIQYRGDEYLIGVTPGGINLLEKRVAAPGEASDEGLTKLEEI